MYKMVTPHSKDSDRYSLWYVSCINVTLVTVFALLVYNSLFTLSFPDKTTKTDITYNLRLDKVDNHTV